ncbi:MAG: serine dehydratase beta chain, partial [Mariprofundus sp.]
MFISVLELFKIGIGPSSSHTLGPMVAANDFIHRITDQTATEFSKANTVIRCTLKGSLAFTGKGHSTDSAIALGLHGHLPDSLVDKDVALLVRQIREQDHINIGHKGTISFCPNTHIVFDKSEPLAEHPNGIVFELLNHDGTIIDTETCFSIGGGFISTLAEIKQLQAPLKLHAYTTCKYPFDSAAAMLQMARENGISIAHMKKHNELEHISEQELHAGMDRIWESMQMCID